MNTTTRNDSFLDRLQVMGYEPFASDRGREVFWIAVLAAFVTGLAAVFHRVLGPVPIPERFLDAIVFGGVLVLVAAAWQSHSPRGVAALFGAAVVIALLGVYAPVAAALLATAVACAALAHLVAAKRLMMTWGLFSVGLATWRLLTV